MVQAPCEGLACRYAVVLLALPSPENRWMCDYRDCDVEEEEGGGRGRGCAGWGMVCLREPCWHRASDPAWRGRHGLLTTTQAAPTHPPTVSTHTINNVQERRNLRGDRGHSAPGPARPWCGRHLSSLPLPRGPLHHTRVPGPQAGVCMCGIRLCVFEFVHISGAMLTM